MSAEPCGACKAPAWCKWAEKICWETGAMPEGKPRLCDACRERLRRLAAQYQAKEVG